MYFCYYITILDNFWIECLIIFNNKIFYLKSKIKITFLIYQTSSYVSLSAKQIAISGLICNHRNKQDFYIRMNRFLHLLYFFFFFSTCWRFLSHYYNIQIVAERWNDSLMIKVGLMSLIGCSWFLISVHWSFFGMHAKKTIGGVVHKMYNACINLSKSVIKCDCVFFF